VKIVEVDEYSIVRYSHLYKVPNKLYRFVLKSCRTVGIECALSVVIALLLHKTEVKPVVMDCVGYTYSTKVVTNLKY
jgi:hypothetical protein